MNNLYLIIERLDRIEKKLNGNYTDPYLSIKEVSEFCSLSQSTIRRAVYRGHLKCSRSTGKLLFKKSDVLRWLDG